MAADTPIETIETSKEKPTLCPNNLDSYSLSDMIAFVRDQYADLPKSRTNALVITKLDEAYLWSKHTEFNNL